MEVFKMILVVVVLLAIGMAGMGITILVKKNGRFPESRVGHNKEMRKRKIYCVKTQDVAERKRYFKKLKEQQNSSLIMDYDEDDEMPKPDFNNLRLADNQ